MPDVLGGVGCWGPETACDVYCKPLEDCLCCNGGEPALETGVNSVGSAVAG